MPTPRRRSRTPTARHPAACGKYRTHVTDRYDTGMQTRRQVLGDAHVDRSLSNATALDADFQRWITETAWGDVWSRPDLDRRTRSLVTIAILGALGKEQE